MGSRTYAYNSILIGALLGALVYAVADSAALGILTFIGVSVVGFFLIRALEKALNRGADAAMDAAARAIQKRREHSDREEK